MRRFGKWFTVVTPILAAAIVAPIFMVADDPPPPSAGDVTVIGQGGAPGRFAQESSILMTNSSYDYDYRVEVSALAENDENGDPACGGTGCLYEACECTLAGIFPSGAGTTRDHKVSCVLPDCRNDGCDPHCDNPSPPADVEHCT